jgi:hypothetical protein
MDRVDCIVVGAGVVGLAVARRMALAGLFGPGAYVKRGEARQDVTSFREAIHWLLDQARKGQYIQRYKGLGEMNPDQLWDTTINPATRWLVSVRIEDTRRSAGKPLRPAPHDHSAANLTAAATTIPDSGGHAPVF